MAGVIRLQAASSLLLLMFSVQLCLVSFGHCYVCKCFV